MADITSETIQKILDLALPIITPITDDKGETAPFSSKPLHQVKVTPPALPETVNVSTLAGFADLVKGKLDSKEFQGEFLIHIVDEDTVRLIARASDVHGRRQVLMEATPMSFQQFPFDHFMPQEEFLIKAAALIADGNDKAYIMRMAAGLNSESGTTLTDDGFTQSAVVKAALKLVERLDLKPMVDLAPYRTFPEVPQPVSSFIFRARTEAQPMLALFEADGGRWKVDAIATIRAAMAAFGLEIPIIA